MTGLEYLINHLDYARGDQEGMMHIGLKVDDYFKAQQQDEYNINTQIEILQDVLNELMTGFESPEDRWDFILDIVNGYKDRIL